MPRYQGPVVVGQDVRRELSVTDSDFWSACSRLRIPRLMRFEVDPKRVCIPLEDVERLRQALAHRRLSPEQLAEAEQRQRERYNAWAKRKRKRDREAVMSLTRGEPAPTEPEAARFGLAPDPTLGLPSSMIALVTVAERTRVPVRVFLKALASGDVEQVKGYDVVHVHWVPALERIAARWLDAKEARAARRAMVRGQAHARQPDPVEVERLGGTSQPATPSGVDPLTGVRPPRKVRQNPLQGPATPSAPPSPPATPRAGGEPGGGDIDPPEGVNVRQNPLQGPAGSPAEGLGGEP